MQETASFQVNSRVIGDIVRNAVDEGHMSLSSIASLAGLSVPTIARLYKGEVNEIQARTARVVASALGYSLDLSRSGVARVTKEEVDSRSGGLTHGQKQRLLKAIQRAVERELERF